MNPTSVEALTTAVLAHPAGRDCRVCALARLPSEIGHLDGRAREVGFTTDEAFGIMDGWDVASGASDQALFADDYANKREYHAGVELGKRLWRLLEAH